MKNRGKSFVPRHVSDIYVEFYRNRNTPELLPENGTESLLFGNRCSDQNLTSRRQKRSLARVLESRDNAWEDDEDVPFHRTSDRACWPMINRDNVRDRYRISIKVSALVRFSSMLRLTDRTRKKINLFLR